MKKKKKVVKAVQALVDADRGLVHARAYSDEEVYREEMERVFGHTWLFVGHESSIPSAGDYITNYMGEDAVIVLRDSSCNVRVFLNKCLHRGNEVCLFDRGRANTFTCSFHGWQYDTQGKLVGVPFFDTAYLGRLNRDELKLVEPPRVEVYGGMIFASWDMAIASLRDYLGAFTWYLDRLLVHEHLGGMQVVGGRQRFFMPTNWKLLADNFAGDDYHVPTTHASYFKIMTGRSESFSSVRSVLHDALQVSVGYSSGVPHGLGVLRLGPETSLYESDLATADRLGAEAVDWVKERYRRIQEHYGNDPVQVQVFSNGNIFPNLSMISSGAAFLGRGLIQWHPRGPLKTEGWEWCVVEKDAPKIVKETAIRALTTRQSAAGMIQSDDTENFERATDNLASHVAKKQPFHYAMAMGFDQDHPALQEFRDKGWPIDHLPGLVGPFNWEVNQRQFYRYWAELMAAKESD